MSIPVSPTHLAAGLVLFIKGAKALQYTKCTDAFQKLIANNITTINGELIYFDTSDNSSVTYDACKAVCGEMEYSIADDCGPRLSSWVLPVVILAVSVQHPPLALPQRILAISRMTGDPVGSLLWMVRELRFYEYCLDEGIKTAAAWEYHFRLTGMDKGGPIDHTTATAHPGIHDEEKLQNLAGNFARIFHAVSMAKGGRDPSETSQHVQQAIAELTKLELSKRTAAVVGFRNQVNQLGRAIVQRNLKSRSTSRSCFAVACFLIPLIVAIVPWISPPASGGMITSILTLSPLLLMVFLSNAIGEYSNLASLERELEDFRKNIPGEIRHMLENPLSVTVSKENTTAFQYMRRSMTRQSVRASDMSGVRGWIKRHLPDWILPLVMFSLAIGSASGAIGTAPTFFHERHFVLIAIALAWLGSWALTSWGNEKHQARHLVASVHLIVAIAVPVFLAGMTCGWIGTCKTWSGYFRYGAENARMPLYFLETFKRYGREVYPPLVSVCLGGNLVAFGVIRFLSYRLAFRLIAGHDEKVGAGNTLIEVELVDLSEVPQIPQIPRISFGEAGHLA
ncbi:hypothetical protein V8F33_006981 [Rhypophila sp. PSN 637]